MSNAKPTAPPPSRQTRRVSQAAVRPARQIAWPVVVAGLGAVTLVALVVFATLNTINERNARTQPIAGVREFLGVTREHTASPVNYEQLPPVGGPHFANWQNCGIYAEPLTTEYVVHSLEHGAVWVTYQPEIDSAQVTALRQLLRGRPFTILSPFPGQDAPVIASAWGLQLKLDNANDPRLAQFISRYAQGPQTPELGAACTGGVGQPSQ